VVQKRKNVPIIIMGICGGHAARLRAPHTQNKTNEMQKQEMNRVVGCCASVSVVRFFFREEIVFENKFHESYR
jgi:hypothetical protein